MIRSLRASASRDYCDVNNVRYAEILEAGDENPMTCRATRIPDPVRGFVEGKTLLTNHKTAGRYQSGRRIPPDVGSHTDAAGRVLTDRTRVSSSSARECASRLGQVPCTATDKDKVLRPVRTSFRVATVVGQHDRPAYRARRIGRHVVAGDGWAVPHPAW